MGTIQIDGSTPKLTIGNATAEDATILFDGNAQDFYIALDDSADDLLIGLGSTVGTTPIIAIDENKLSTFSGAITVGVDDTGHDVKLFGASAGSYALWDESANLLDLRGATAAGPGNLKLTTGELTVVDADVLGKIEFQAPLEASGTDAILVGAAIWAEADDTFAAGVNNTDLVFALGKSEAAAEKFRFTADTEIGIGGANYGTDGQVLTSGGAGAAVAWEDAGGGSDPASADGDTLGTASLEWSDLYLADGGQILFGNDQEITLTHSADSGLLLKHTATADDKPINLVLQTGETDMAADDVIGKISWQAPDEGTGTDAILVSAAIQAVAEGDHSSSSNATRLEFHTGASELATSQMTISSSGIVGIGAVPTGDLGVGLHIKTGDSGQSSPAGGSDELIIEGSANSGMSILSGTSNTGNIVFGDSGGNGQGLVYYNHSTDNLILGAGGTDGLKINSAGSLILPQSGQGIYLGVTAATAANLLDDYEEGTWTPAFANAGSATFNTDGQQGSYTKIGRLVTVSFNMSISGLGGGSGDADVTGVPFAASNTPTNSRYVSNIFGDDSWDTDLSSDNMTSQIYGDYLNTRIFLQKNIGDNKAQIQLSDIGTSRLTVTITYFTDS